MEKNAELDAICWICGDKTGFNPCANKFSWYHSFCSSCKTSSFINENALCLYAPIKKEGVKQDLQEVQAFPQLKILGVTRCPVCLERSFRFKKSKKMQKLGKKGRPKHVSGKTISCFCESCKFRSFVKQGYGKYIEFRG